MFAVSVSNPASYRVGQNRCIFLEILVQVYLGVSKYNLTFIFCDFYVLALASGILTLTQKGLIALLTHITRKNKRIIVEYCFEHFSFTMFATTA